MTDKPTRPLRVLGMEGWLSWRFVKRDSSSTTYALDFGAETAEMEDFGEV